MALKTTAPPCPLFSPFLPPSRRPATELHFSRWNNANAQPFIRRRREQHEIEADIRLHRRHHRAGLIASPTDHPDPADAPSPEFHSVGTPSSPSSPSIRGKISKYSKPPQKPRNSSSHPAFRRIARARIPREPDEQAGIVIGEQGIAYRMKNAPFEFQYSYTETPKVKPLALREAPFLPFGPSTMPRPWTGRAPLPASKKKRPEFDSFKPPPPGKKGVKPVQAPGPFLAGSAPKYKAMTREEILGEPLTEEEVKELIKSTLKTTRQLNMGRDGLTHNMLDNIHAHWKRRRVCKIKCKGVCTVDMDNVWQQLEEKTGGKIIYNKGGVIFLFRGRNYNYKTRPRYPLMLWKPVTPVYPRLIQQVPEGLTLEEATEMRKRGRKLAPICKLAKNGLYSNLVQHVKEAFEECELVRINCTGLNKSDCRKIGAKLKDLVPCVLISFEYEHILLWRGKDWKSSLPPLGDNSKEDEVDSGVNISVTTPSVTVETLLNLQSTLELSEGKSSDETQHLEISAWSLSPAENVQIQQNIPSNLERSNEFQIDAISDSTNSSEGTADPLTIIEQQLSDSGAVKSLSGDSCTDVPCQDVRPDFEGSIHSVNTEIESEQSLLEEPCLGVSGLGVPQTQVPILEESDSSYMKEKETQLLATSDTCSCLHVAATDLIIRQDGDSLPPEVVGAAVESSECDNGTRATRKYLDPVMLLLRQAVNNGSALVLDDDSLDANIILERSVALAKAAPPGPTFRHGIWRKSGPRKTKRKEVEIHEEELVGQEAVTDSEKKTNGRKDSRTRSMKRDGFVEVLSDAAPHGSLRIDELAQLLA